MSNGVKAIIIVACVLFATLAFVFFGGMAMGVIQGEPGSFGVFKENRGTVALSVDALQTLEISAGSADVVFHESDKEPYVEYSIKAKGLIFGNPDLDISQNTGRTNIKPSRFTSLFGIYKCNIEIWCSKDSIENLELRLSSGSAVLAGYEFEKAKFGLSSGILEMKDIKADTVGITISSGKVSVQGLDSEDVTCSASSGDLTLEDTDAGRVDISCSSGSTRFSGSAEKLDISISSGRVIIDTAIMPSDLSCTASSGLIEVAMPESSEGFTLEYSRSSGNIKSDFPLAGEILGSRGTAQYGQGKRVFRTKVSSGTIYLKKK